MQYIVRNKETGQFLTSQGAWTKLISQAHQFPNGRSIPLHLEALSLEAQRNSEILRLGEMQ